MDATDLFLGIALGAVGTAYFIYGKKQARMVPLLCGLALMVCPYFLPSPLWTTIAGAVLILFPFLAARWWDL